MNVRCLFTGHLIWVSKFGHLVYCRRCGKWLG